MFPTYSSIDLTIGIKIRFNAKIFDISGGEDYGSVFTISAKYDNSDFAVFSLTQPIVKSTSCNDKKWHFWETIVYKYTVRVYCDEKLEYIYSRIDSQETWDLDYVSPFLAIGAHYPRTSLPGCLAVI